ncbi:hypothetical protein BC828DRAFT_398405 [Blastocladiella britannica]|nr:hypothetical protein BC828DRAFT_398405 [Blastocladiella britannica]
MTFSNTFARCIVHFLAFFVFMAMFTLGTADVAVAVEGVMKKKNEVACNTFVKLSIVLSAEMVSIGEPQVVVVEPVIVDPVVAESVIRPTWGSDCDSDEDEEAYEDDAEDHTTYDGEITRFFHTVAGAPRVLDDVDCQLLCDSDSDSDLEMGSKENLVADADEETENAKMGTTDDEEAIYRPTFTDTRCIFDDNAFEQAWSAADGKDKVMTEEEKVEAGRLLVEARVKVNEARMAASKAPLQVLTSLPRFPQEYFGTSMTEWWAILQRFKQPLPRCAPELAAIQGRFVMPPGGKLSSSGYSH